MVLIFFALALLIMFANFVYFCTTRGKKTTFHEKVVETLARNSMDS